MKKIILILLMLFSLTSCIVPEKIDRTLPPSYLLLLTNDNIHESFRCAGTAIDEYHVLTAYHCLIATTRRIKILTQYNQEVDIYSYYYDKGLDIVVIKTNVPMYMEEYPKFDDAKIAQIGQAYGLCNRYFYFNPRYVLNMGLLKDNSYYQKFIDSLDIKYTSTWIVTNTKFQICLGDSGGIIIQDGKIVGLMQAILSLPFYGKGEHLYTLNGKAIEKFINEAIQELKID